MKKFSPIPDGDRGSRKDRILCADIGKGRKERLIEFCDKNGTSQTSMIKQMIDHCMSEGAE